MREILRWPWWLWLLISGLDFSIVIALWAGLGNFAAIIGLLVVIILTLWMYFFTSLQIDISEKELMVGRAHIDRSFLGKVSVLDSLMMSHFLHAGINPSAYHAVRFWVKSGIKVEINDPKDPTPYWLISTKKGTELARLLEN